MDDFDELVRRICIESARILLWIDQVSADVILDQAAERDANLLVIGAYSHPRTTEILFGGVTRSLLSSARVPLLISR